MINRNKYIFGFLVVVVVIGAALFKVTPKQTPVFDDRQKIAAQIGGSPTLILEVVNTSSSTTLGLSGRDNIGAEGMLFIFNNDQVRSFWMKDMRFDLDLIWLNDHKIVNISENVPAPIADHTDQKLPTYSSQVSVDMVLEIPAGKANQWQLQVGDELVFN